MDFWTLGLHTVWSSKYWVLSLLLWLGLLTPNSAASMSADPKVLHLINRLSFGPRPGDIERIESMGVERYIQEQLSPESIPYPASLTNQINSLETINQTPEELFIQYGPPQRIGGQKPSREVVIAARIGSHVILEQAVQARLLRATESPRQLQEVMTDFWYNHFNVFADKGLDRLWIGAYEEQAIRPYVLGHFSQLLAATAQHPAMLYYLDNWQNTAPNSPGARGRFHGLNENYARELMELHTLGVDGGYTQQDVIALARILTGWGFRRFGQQADNMYEVYFDAKRHDFGDKVFLGHTIKGSGIGEGEQALDILAHSPATAHHISYELAQYFVAEQPPPALVERLAKRFLQTDGDISEVLKTLFHSPEFEDPKNYGTKFKTPYQYVVSAIRATGMEVNNFKPIYSILQQLGMPLYGCQTPDGYKNTQSAWLNPDAMTRRLSFATALASENGGALDLDGHFGLHPALAPLMSLWRQGSLAFVDACGSPDPTRSHFEAQDYMESGTPGVKGTPDGWMNRLLATLPSHTAVQAVKGDTTPRILSGRMNVASLPLGRNSTRSLPLDQPQVGTAFDRLYAGNDSLSQAYQEGRKARKTLLTDLNAEMTAANNGAPLPLGFASDAQRLAQLMVRDPSIELAFLALGGWDTHVNRSRKFEVGSRK